MRMIDKLMHQLEEEVEGAKHYAEKYLENAARGNNSRAVKFKEMANDELKHAGYVRDFAMLDIDEVRRVYHIPDADLEKWEHFHRQMAEQMALVRHMLAG